MSKRKFYRTVVQVEILSEDPFVLDESDGNGITSPLLDAISEAVTSGHCSGDITAPVLNEEKTGPEMAVLLKAQRSDPGFFNLDGDADYSVEEDDHEPDPA